MKKAILTCALVFFGSGAYADVTRHALPNNSTFPISRAVEVTADTTLIYHSGTVPGAANPDADRGRACLAACKIPSRNWVSALATLSR
jgi:hypothetical protein